MCCKNWLPGCNNKADGLSELDSGQRTDEVTTANLGVDVNLRVDSLDLSGPGLWLEVNVIFLSPKVWYLLGR